MESSTPDSPRTPADDLALIGRTQGALDGPSGFLVAYDLLYALTCGVLVAAQALPSMPRGIATVVVVLILVALISWWRRRLGWWLNGYSPRRARWVSIGLVVLLIALMAWVWLRPEGRVALTAGVLAAVGAFGLSRLWGAVWRRERRSAA